MRIIVTVLIIVLVVAGFGIVFNNINGKTLKAQQELNQERYHKMVAEEGLGKANNKISSLESQLLNAEQKILNTEKLLKKEKIVNSDLKKRLDKISEIKRNLEEKIQELMKISSGEF